MLIIPILIKGCSPSKAYIVALKRAIASDGCSKSPDIYGRCCVLHDLAYRFGIDCYGQPMKKKAADQMLRTCMQQQSKLGRWSLISRLYWSGVHFFGFKAYATNIDERPPFELRIFADPS